MKNFAVSFLFFAVIFSSFSAFADDATIPSPTPSPAPQCGVPVCDIPAAIDALRAGREGDRYNYITNLINTDDRLQDVPSLQNLVAVAAAVKALSVEEKDEDYVPRACDQLSDLMAVSLAKYDSSDAAKLFSYYQQITNIDERFQVLAYWILQVPTIEDISLLDRLLKLGTNALNMEKQWDGSRFQYVPDEARTLLKNATDRLEELDPYNEGAFDIVMKGMLGQDLPYRLLTVRDQVNDGGLDLFFVDPTIGRPTFIIPNVNFVSDASHMFGLVDNPSYPNAPSTVTVTFDRKSGTVSGVVRTTLQAKDISFSGRESRLVSSLFGKVLPPKLTNAQIEGVYQGTIGNESGTVTLKQLTPIEWGARLATSSGQNIEMLIHGEYFAKTGVLTLVVYAAGQEVGKLAVNVVEGMDQKQGPVVNLVGFEYSTMSGEVMEVRLQKQRDVTHYQASASLPAAPLK